jgi:hypothetical protein
MTTRLTFENFQQLLPVSEQSQTQSTAVTPLFPSLLDAIRMLDMARRLAPSCGPLLQDSPGILSVS